MWTQRAPTHGATNLSRHATNLQPRQPTSRKNLLCKPDGIDSAEIRQLLLTAKAREPPHIQALHFSPAGSRGAQQGSPTGSSRVPQSGLLCPRLGEPASRIGRCRKPACFPDRYPITGRFFCRALAASRTVFLLFCLPRVSEFVCMSEENEGAVKGLARDTAPHHDFVLHSFLRVQLCRRGSLWISPADLLSGLELTRHSLFARRLRVSVMWARLFVLMDRPPALLLMKPHSRGGERRPYEGFVSLPSHSAHFSQDV
ncbi:hypothetical protein MRX96_043502 [Rhipicephalus microplus]